MPSWFGARCSDRRVSTAPRRVLTKICERVRGCRADCSRQYEVIDFLAVQIALRASSANADFQLSTRDCGPKLAPTCAWFDRDRLRASSTLSRDFSARTTEPGRAPCAPCFSTICERSPLSRREACQVVLVEREGGTRVVFEIDGTRERPRRVCFPFRLDHADCGYRMPRPKRLVSRRLDRDPSQSMHAQREGEFTSMMQIVLNEMPDHPLACIGLIFSILIGIVNHFCQIGNGPVVQGILNDLPGGFQSIDQ